MRFYLPVFLLLNLVSFSVVFQAETPKMLFETGTFVYVGMENEATIVRKKNQQIETYNGGRTIIVMKIKWENDYTYVLTQKKATNSPKNCMKRGSKIKSIITDFSSDRYSCTFNAGKCGSGSSIIRKIKD